MGIVNNQEKLSAQTEADGEVTGDGHLCSERAHIPGGGKCLQLLRIKMQFPLQPYLLVNCISEMLCFLYLYQDAPHAE